MLHTTVEVKDRSVLYLDVLKSMDNTVNAAIMGTMNIYVNGVLLIERLSKRDAEWIIGTWKHLKMKQSISTFRSSAMFLFAL